jgi:hypothetical protein
VHVDTLFLVWLTSRATTDLVNRALTGTGLDGDEFAVFSVLTAAPAITPTELARWMAAPPTTVSSDVKRFDAWGHVVRVPNPDDRRSYRLVPVRDRVAQALGARTDDVSDALLAVRTVIDDLRLSRPEAGTAGNPCRSVPAPRTRASSVGWIQRPPMRVRRRPRSRCSWGMSP